MMYRGLDLSPMYNEVPVNVFQSLELYVDAGIRPGYFLQSVIANDLEAAISTADVDSLKNLQAITMLVVKVVPHEKRGSWDAVERTVFAGSK